MQNVTGKEGQKSLIIALAGALVVAVIWYAVSMDVMTTLIFGLPIGGVGALIVYRTIERIRQEKAPPASPSTQAAVSGKEPEGKVGDAKTKTPLKLK